jgi:8-oxo-dGTP diphosphatase
VRTRYAAYAVCIEAGSVLLTQLADTEILDAGGWTLPGGGLEWREPPEQGVLRELYEEAGLHGRVRSILGVDTEILPPTADRDALHAVRFVYSVEATGEPRVVERNGSTVAARWVPYGQLMDIPLVSLVPRALGMV